MGNPYGLLLYILPLYFLTVFFSLDFVKQHFNKMYGDNTVKMIGWNSSTVAAKVATPEVVTAICLGTVGAVGIVVADAALAGPY